MINHIQIGTVYHARHKPFFHAFKNRVFTFIIDWDRLNELTRQSRFFSHNRWNLLSLNNKDHGPRDGSDPCLWIREEAKKAGIDCHNGKIIFQGFPRVLGYVFNPLSLFYLYNKDNQLVGVVYQVKNTFGGQHCYVLPIQGNDRTPRQSARKQFYVSPFIGMDCTYHFTLTPPDGDTFFTAIHQDEGESKVLTATWSGEQALPFTDTSLLRVFCGIPFMSLKIILAIHWQALRLVIKGARYRSGNKNPDHPVSHG